METKESAEVLLDIAKRDLEASKVLHDEQFFSQCIFYLQQSIEKATKSYADMRGIYQNLEEIKQEVNHYPIKVFKKSLDDSIEDSEQMKDIPSLEPFLPSNMKKYLEENREFVQKIDNLKEKRAIPPSRAIKGLLEDAEEYRNELFKELLNVEDSKIEEVWKLWKELESELELSSRIENKEEFERQLEESREDTFDELYIGYSLLNLIIMVSPKHAILTRYPEEDIEPSDIYTKNYPLIKFYGEIIELLEKILTRMDRLLSSKLENK